ncbi:aspartate-semialdehyde dehydrogenase [Azospirillum sp. RWY-5-1]|uniref:Aspartate-semialdehyde dehydrogenase n=1 Tax=Azospirillum oleiclasticum TaxID=2735135 RepID=A0ABX2T7X0_9PROT|nr:aspartate-semialdehyde dehydrogenase [Azospirillum oleiclasticum]NYZ12181.1 aspartate-semialdehyde dehydrogenase [Azospirillum oleiclasticum]NYZ19341.1 aspartate-semialdehyde dehydrogenase [Azospirillum oleiclasticum]
MSNANNPAPRRVAVVGATGAVGREMVEVLHRRSFPVSELRLLASGRSAGKVMETPYGAIALQEFSVDRVKDCDVVLLAVSGDFAKAHAPAIAAAGPLVIDNSSAFRYDADIPLIVPEINAAAFDVSNGGGGRLIANPNCTTAIAVVALGPLHRAFGLKRVIVSTYQATSGAGAEGMAELEEQTRNRLEGRPVTNSVFHHPIPFNLIPHIDAFQENGYTKEEMKVTWETRKILGLPDLPVSCTAVRIPTYRAHSEAITIETIEPVTAEAARRVLADAAGVKLVDDTANAVYPMPLTATGQFDVEVGRVRNNPVFGDHGLDLFVCGDQLLKGAALNAVQIAELDL